MNYTFPIHQFSKCTNKNWSKNVTEVNFMVSYLLKLILRMSTSNSVDVTVECIILLSWKTCHVYTESSSEQNSRKHSNVVKAIPLCLSLLPSIGTLLMHVLLRLLFVSSDDSQTVNASQVKPPLPKRMAWHSWVW